MQNYYCLAIYNNNNNLYGIKKAVRAILLHCTYTNSDSSCHHFCSRMEDTWCEWQYDQLNWTNTHKSHISIPKWIHSISNLVFMELPLEIFLRKCVHGETQNTNECLKVAPRVKKIEVFKKGWNFENHLFYELQKTIFSIIGERNNVFSLFLPKKLFSTALSCLSAQSTSYFTWTSLYF